MKNAGITATSIGLMVNFLLFLTKLYVGLSSNSLSIYCDAINNLGDTFACIIAIFGFVLARKMIDIRAKRTQSLMTFVISIIIAVTGGYFIYNGIDRLFYPLPISYMKNYAVIIIATIFVKIIMGAMFIVFNRKSSSPILKAMAMDSFLDCFITLFTVIGLFLIVKVNYAVDGIFAIVTGAFITISAIKNIITHAKFLITN